MAIDHRILLGAQAPDFSGVAKQIGDIPINSLKMDAMRQQINTAGQAQASKQQVQQDFNDATEWQRIRGLHANDSTGIEETIKNSKLEQEDKDFLLNASDRNAAFKTLDDESTRILQSATKTGQLGRVTPGVDKEGNPVYFQAGTKPGQGPTVVPGITPPKSDASIAFATEQLKLAEKKKQRLRDGRDNAVLLSADVNHAIELSDVWGTTGFTGSLISAIAGTPAGDLKETLLSIKARTGFNQLQDMREASSTGGAVGQVSDMEQKLLASVFGSMEQSQSKKQLLHNLKRYKIVQDAIVLENVAIPFTQEEYDSLQPGSQYISDVDGSLMMKPNPQAVQ